MGTPNSPRWLHGPKLASLLAAISTICYILIFLLQYFASQKKKQNIEIIQPYCIFHTWL